jgi:hypothetical protein
VYLERFFRNLLLGELHCHSCKDFSLLVDEFLVFWVLSVPDSDFALWAGRKFWCTREIFFAGERGVLCLSSDTAKVRQFSENVKIFRKNF